MQCSHVDSFPLEPELPETFKYEFISTKVSEFPKISHTIHNHKHATRPVIAIETIPSQAKCYGSNHRLTITLAMTYFNLPAYFIPSE